MCLDVDVAMTLNLMSTIEIMSTCLKVRASRWSLCSMGSMPLITSTNNPAMRLHFIITGNGLIVVYLNYFLVALVNAIVVGLSILFLTWHCWQWIIRYSLKGRQAARLACQGSVDNTPKSNDCRILKQHCRRTAGVSIPVRID